jgi:hypothetical protein
LVTKDCAALLSIEKPLGQVDIKGGPEAFEQTSLPPLELPSPKEHNLPPTLEAIDIFQKVVKENEEANLEDGIIQLDELKVLPSSPIVAELNLGVLKATKKPQEENLVVVITSNLEVAKHG